MKRFILLISAVAIPLLLSCKKDEVKDEAKVDLESISFDRTELILEKGKKDVLSVTLTPSNASDKILTWVSTDTDVATVEDGIISAIAPGKADIIAKSGLILARCKVTVIIAAKGIQLNKSNLEICKYEEENLVATLNPVDATEAVVWSSSDSTVAKVADGKVTAVGVGPAVITAKAASFEAECEVTVKPPRGSVDLGIAISLPNGTKYNLYWAASNLKDSGLCTNPEDYGDYYSWGETSKKSAYSWGSYKYGTSQTGPFSKYNSTSSLGPVDGKTVLEPNDDAARVTLGDHWRMPTQDEWDALREQCDWVFTDNYSGTGVAGEIITATNGSKIFLPAAGYQIETGPSNLGINGYYWSSSLFTTLSYCGKSLHFTTTNINTTNFSRYYGMSIRPVCN